MLVQVLVVHYHRVVPPLVPVCYILSHSSIGHLYEDITSPIYNGYMKVRKFPDHLPIFN